MKKALIILGLLFVCGCENNYNFKRECFICDKEVHTKYSHHCKRHGLEFQAFLLKLFQEKKDILFENEKGQYKLDFDKWEELK